MPTDMAAVLAGLFVRRHPRPGVHGVLVEPLARQFLAVAAALPPGCQVRVVGAFGRGDPAIVDDARALSALEVLLVHPNGSMLPDSAVHSFTALEAARTDAQVVSQSQDAELRECDPHRFGESVIVRARPLSCSVDMGSYGPGNAASGRMEFGSAAIRLLAASDSLPLESCEDPLAIYRVMRTVQQALDSLPGSPFVGLPSLSEMQAAVAQWLSAPTRRSTLGTWEAIEALRLIYRAHGGRTGFRSGDAVSGGPFESGVGADYIALQQRLALHVLSSLWEAPPGTASPSAFPERLLDAWVRTAGAFSGMRASHHPAEYFGMRLFSYSDQVTVMKLSSTHRRI
ncbi:hypothetical protein ACO0M4_28860 [Streptomyces sp. RGM 3693]|uniref:hypothetical protein n=1 Tax=Streptomyces sp. RGM 3693 TaxID=3413284 RepID=UPI003D282445